MCASPASIKQYARGLRHWKKLNEKKLKVKRREKIGSENKPFMFCRKFLSRNGSTAPTLELM